MATSPSHKFGQIIGDALEATIEPILIAFAEKHDLFLDRKGKRSIRKGSKLTWKDHYENAHDLDFVLERNGSDKSQGEPVAFIELAWRRYTKHSRNKSQEIQGAIIPLRDKHKHLGPFIGVILAGEFTDAALVQLRSLGFAVAHFSYKSVVEAFNVAGIDAKYDESTSAKDFRAKNSAWDKLNAKQKISVYQSLATLNADNLKPFIDSLTSMVQRTVEQIRILSLYGEPIETPTLDEAITAIKSLESTSVSKEFARVEVQIRYINGNRIDADFRTKEEALEFLSRQIVPKPKEGQEILDAALDVLKRQGT